MNRVTALLIVVCAAVNLPSLFPGFIHDDHPIVERNPAVNEPGRVPDLLTQGYWSVEKTVVNNLYRPVTLLSFALNRAVGGEGAFAYRLVNLALHVLVTLLVLAVGRRLTGPPAGRSRPQSWIDAPILAALLFAVHPVHTEVLGLIVGRAELLAAAGVLGSVALFLAARGSGGAGDPGIVIGAGRRRALLALAIAVFVLGSLSKENAIVAPALILAADLLIVGGRPVWGFHLLSAGAAAAVLGLRVLVLGRFDLGGGTHFLDNPMMAASFLEGRLTALAAIPRYLEVLVVPWRLSIDYSYDALPIARSPADPRVIAGVAVIGAAVWAVWRSRRSAPGLAYAVVWIGLAFAPVANLLVPIGTIMAERLLYLPSAGFCWLVALVLDRPARRPARAATGPGPEAARAAPAGTMALVLPAAIVIVFGIRSEVRYLDWRDDHAIFASAVQVVPRSAKARFNYGAACEDRRDLPAARAAYEQAIAIWPEFADAHYNLAGILAGQREVDAAVAHYREAIRLQPFNVRYLVNLAVAVAEQGNQAEARDLARRALEIDRTSDEAWTVLGTSALVLGDTAAAVEAYDQALRLDPGRPILMFNLALAQERHGDIEAAIATYRRGVAADPTNQEMARGLAMALLAGGGAVEARRILEALVRAAPDHPIYRYQLGQTLEALGEDAAAVAAYREAARLAPGAPVPHRALGRILLRQGDRDGARAALERAAAADPEAWARDAEGRRLLDDLRAGRRPGARGE